MQRILFVLLAAAYAFAAPASAQQQSGRAPLDWFYGYEQFRGAEMSPNGRYVAVIRHDAIGDTLMVVDLETRQSRAIQTARADDQMEIAWVDFKTDDRVLFGVTQKIHVVTERSSIHRDVTRADDAFEFVYRIYATSTDGSDRVALYDPSAGQGFPRELNANLISTLPHDDDHVLLIVPDWNAARLWRVNVRTGEHTEVEQGGVWTVGWLVDAQGTPVLRQDLVNSGRGRAWLRRGPGQRGWTEIIRFRGADAANSAPTFEGIGPAIRPGQVFVLARREGDDTSGLYVYDTATGQFAETLQRNSDFDVYDARVDRENNVVLAACWWAHRWMCEPKDVAFGRHWRAITQALGDDVNVRLVGRGGQNGARWLIHTDGPRDLGTYALYDTQSHSLNTLFTVRPFNPALLPTQQVVEYAASDGTRLWGYLWLPPGVQSARNLPLIVVPHGGPEARDVWGFDPFASTFASQGYAVFQPNFRGGGGFGRRFVEAGHRQWGRRIQEDVADGTRHLIAQGIADPNRVCIMGWSHGGYVTFTASFMNTDLYRCAIAGAGVSDLNAMLRWERAGSVESDVSSGGGWGASSVSYRYWTEAIGEESRELNRFSAAQNAERATVPLLIIHGDEDQTVPFEQSEIMERAMRRAGKPARLIRLEDMDHYYRPDNADGWRTTFTESLAFFNQHIGPGVPPPGATNGGSQ